MPDPHAYLLDCSGPCGQFFILTPPPTDQSHPARVMWLYTQGWRRSATGGFLCPGCRITPAPLPSTRSRGQIIKS